VAELIPSEQIKLCHYKARYLPPCDNTTDLTPCSRAPSTTSSLHPEQQTPLHSNSCSRIQCTREAKNRGAEGL